MIKIGLLWTTFISTQNAFLLRYGSLVPFWEYSIILCIREIKVYYSKNNDDAFLLDRTSNTILSLCGEVDDMIGPVRIICSKYELQFLFILNTFFLSFWEWIEVSSETLIIISIRSPNIKIFNCSQHELYIRDWGLL